MDQESKKKEIDEAVEVFRKTLEETYLKYDIPFHGISVVPLTQGLTGKIEVNRKKDGSMRIAGCLPSDCFRDDLEGLPRKFEDYKIYPLLVGLFNVPESELKDKEKKGEKGASKDGE